MPRWVRALRGVDGVMARQLETLALAAMARAVTAPRAKLTYECLDVHRLMTARSAPGRALRALEGGLLRRCGLLLVSSPGFVREHFAKAYSALPPVRLVENRVLESELAPGELARLTAVRTDPHAVGQPQTPGSGPAPGLPPGPPWRIGWFGMIRDARSLALLADLVRRLPGRVEVVIRGRPARTAVPEFDRTVAGTPGLRFLGPYDRATELAAIYGDVHFTWAVDFYEAGANSDWLLPNRLYEGGLYGTVPIALAEVETGRWLAAKGAGLLLREPLEETLPALLESMDADRYAAAKRAAAIPLTELTYGRTDAEALCAALVAP